jgi:hypothetical protein
MQQLVYMTERGKLELWQQHADGEWWMTSGQIHWSRLNYSYKRQTTCPEDKGRILLGEL